VGDFAPSRPGSALPRLVVLDRDGTLIEETDYLVDPAAVRLLPGAAHAVARLNRAGVHVAIATNQSAIARGWLTEEGLERVHRHLAALLEREGAHVDLWRHCGHHPDHSPSNAREEARRKPAPGMLLEALAHFHVPPEAALVIGDSDRDLEAGERAGVHAVLVLTGKGADELPRARARLRREPDVAPDLAAAVAALFRRDNATGAG
jgi:D-glycero-D-manno-heptose 1,7-bisphosphate phosphatase